MSTSMYAVIEAGGKQYRVQAGDFLQIEKQEGEVDSTVRFDQVLFYSSCNADAPKILIGKPLLAGACVEGQIVGQGRGDKILIVKMKRRKQYRRTQGHRQEYTQLLITQIQSGAGDEITLSGDEKKVKLSQFQSHLKPKGEAFTAPLLGSRKKRLAAKSMTTVPVGA